MGTGELPVFLPWIPTPEGAAGGTTLGVTGAAGTGLPANSFTIVGIWSGQGALSLTGRAGPREGNRPPPGAGAWCGVVPPASDELVGCAVLGCPEASSGVPEQGPSSLSVVERPTQLPSYPVQLNKPVTECLPRGLPRARSDRSVCNQPREAVTGPPDRRGTREVLGSSCGPHAAGGPRAPPLL